MARALRKDTALAASILGLGLLLTYVGRILVSQWQSAEHHGQSMSFEQLLGFVSSAAGAGIVVWWILSLLIAFLVSLLHRGGRQKSADSLSKFSPAFMLRLAVAVLSLNLLGATMSQASAAPPDPGWKPETAKSTQAAPAAWTPMSLVGSAPVPQTAGIGAAETPVDDPRWQPRPLVTDPGLLSRQSSRQIITANEVSVVVESGDTLWSIAASRLGPFATDVDVALAWPKWYAANRTTIGGDPSVLLPGQVLRPPLPG
ncbi:LysM peptidoglycan-binding domain-containing protein [Arthrobacter sp. 18067]|uniref:LysM peptidoglycan-binding domain-containing protein n=1 Tax=Arthrobacter sp. 18067 TaxID=2681413 RepID=UPI00135B04CA|nr:LysM peptidoglycan-binding domain-containing protein [Arthrobacter sp. 18067]